MRDLNLLRRAAADFFAEGFAAPEVERAMRGTGPELQEAARKALAPPRTVPDGCFQWIHYLVWLEGVLEITDVPLTAEEVEALRTLQRERNRFQAEHPACPRCGMPNESHALRCRECMEEIGK